MSNVGQIRLGAAGPLSCSEGRSLSPVKTHGLCMLREGSGRTHLETCMWAALQWS